MDHDVAIAGGGPAGLAAALTLARMRRSVVLFDNDDPAHGVSDAVHGMFGHDGTPPHELRRLGREQLLRYESVTLVSCAVDAVTPVAGGFAVQAGASAVEVPAVLLATGMGYGLPPLDGVADVWGRGAYHCPYCHGWEVRDRSVAAYGPDAAGLALLLVSLCDDIVVFTGGIGELDADDAALLQRAGIPVRDDRVRRVEAADGGVLIVFEDGSAVERAAIFFMPRVEASPLGRALGCDTTESGLIHVDADGRTSVAGVFAAGDATTDRRAVVLAAAGGSRAAYAICSDLARGRLPLAEAAALR